EPWPERGRRPGRALLDLRELALDLAEARHARSGARQADEEVAYVERRDREEDERRVEGGEGADRELAARELPSAREDEDRDHELPAVPVEHLDGRLALRGAELLVAEGGRERAEARRLALLEDARLHD